MDSDTATKAIGALRIGVGALAWLAPGLAARLFGLDPAGNPQAPYLGRLFGVRDLVIGAGTLSAGAGSRRGWVTAGLACDVADAAAAELGRRGGYLSSPVAALLTVPALSGVALGLLALRD